MILMVLATKKADQTSGEKRKWIWKPGNKNRIFRRAYLSPLSFSLGRSSFLDTTNPTTMMSNTTTNNPQTQPFTPGPDWILLSQGAEARVWSVPNYSSNNNSTNTTRTAICKERFRKSYRHRDLDERLTKQRCRMEARLLQKCAQHGIPVPAVLHVVNNNSYPEPALLFLEYIPGTTVRDCLENEWLVAPHADPNNDPIAQLAHALGSTIAKLHSAGMVHGDLTTSNMIWNSDNKLHLIDLGLAKNTTAAEERAVDLYVLERALQSTHPTLPASFWETVLQVYATECKSTSTTSSKANSATKNKNNNNQQQDTLARLEQVRQRGRKRECFG